MATKRTGLKLREDLQKQFKKHYQQGRTTKPDPDVLQEVDYDDPALKQKDGYLDLDKIRDAHEENEAVINGWNDEAIAQDRWLGRTLRDGVGDGYAVYVVTRENKKSVRIKVCRGLGDDWVSRHFGEECTIPKDYAEDFLDWDFTNGRVIPS